MGRGHGFYREQGRRRLALGTFAIRPGVDSAALDRRGAWLYFAPVTCSALPPLTPKCRAHVRSQPPHPTDRFRPGPQGAPGH